MSTQFQIEKNIPIPPKIRGKAGVLSVALAPLEVGDSFVFEDDANKTEQRLLGYTAKRMGIKVTVRLIGERKYRAWRVE